MNALELGNYDSYFTVYNKDNSRTKLLAKSKCTNFSLNRSKNNISGVFINLKNAVYVTNHTIFYVKQDFYR